MLGSTESLNLSIAFFLDRVFYIQVFHCNATDSLFDKWKNSTVKVKKKIHIGQSLLPPGHKTSNIIPARS